MRKKKYVLCGNMGRWGCLVNGLDFHPLPGSTLGLELEHPISPGGAWTSPPRPFTDFSRKVRKGGKPTERLVVLHFSHCVVIISLPPSLPCLHIRVQELGFLQIHIFRAWYLDIVCRCLGVYSINISALYLPFR